MGHMTPLQHSSAPAVASGRLGRSVIARANIPMIAENLCIGSLDNTIVMLIRLGKLLRINRIRTATLDSREHHRYRKHMAQTFLVFDFGTDEELAQQARHKIDGWKQGFRLDKKVLLKFDRSEPLDGKEKAADEAKSDGEKKGGAKSHRKKPAESSARENVQLIIRLDFSDHERLSHQRWLERIPTEPPFKDAQPKVIRQNDAEFAGTAERFESLP
jgi:hypothetical protein